MIGNSHICIVLIMLLFWALHLRELQSKWPLPCFSFSKEAKYHKTNSHFSFLLSLETHIEFSFNLLLPDFFYQGGRKPRNVRHLHLSDTYLEMFYCLMFSWTFTDLDAHLIQILNLQKLESVYWIYKVLILFRKRQSISELKLLKAWHNFSRVLLVHNIRKPMLFVVQNQLEFAELQN